MSAGCEPTPVPRPRSSGFAASTQIADDVSAAMQLVRQLDQIEETSAGQEIVYHLNRWLESQPADESWSRDPLVDRLPRDLRAVFPLEDLAKRNFRMTDVKFLQEAFWMREVSKWAAQQPLDPLVAEWIKESPPGLVADDAEQLALALRLFDWTVRNIQLDPLLSYPKEEIAGPAPEVPGAPPAPAQKKVPAPLRGELGPGYRYEPWQVLLYGHGDAWLRARVFMLLARQQGLDVVLLGIQDPTSTARPQPWVAALMLNDQLYLFDAAIGLPVPGPEYHGIATLAQVRANPQLLAMFDVDDKLTYPVSANDLPNVLALIDASPGFVSHRMQLLESQLAGKDRLVLSLKPSALAERVRKIQGLTGVTLWATPWETPLFLAVLARVLQTNPSLLRGHLEEAQLLTGLHPLAQGRQRFLLGAFETQDDRLGAKALYLQSCVTEKVLKNLEHDRDAQKQLGLVRGVRDDDQAWAQRLAGARAICVRAKLYASFWLGLVHYETGKYDVAADWLRDRTLAVYPHDHWTPGARYNLARAYESLGALDKARDLYYEDDSPQKHGSLVRARLLKK